MPEQPQHTVVEVSRRLRANGISLELAWWLAQLDRKVFDLEHPEPPAIAQAKSVWIVLADGVPLAVFTEKDRAFVIVGELAALDAQRSQGRFGAALANYRVSEFPLDPESVKVPDGE